MIDFVLDVMQAIADDETAVQQRWKMLWDSMGVSAILWRSGTLRYNLKDCQTQWFSEPNPYEASDERDSYTQARYSRDEMQANERSVRSVFPDKTLSSADIDELEVQTEHNWASLNPLRANKATLVASPTQNFSISDFF
jgi:hypothetical protein